MDISSAVSKANGLTEEKITGISSYKTNPVFSHDERLVLELADAMVQAPAKISDDLWRRLKSSFSENQLVELSAAIAWENYRARYNRVFDIQSDDFSEGAACALPARLPAPEKASTGA
jgi:alkylhydroperoxidase family enzyme